MILSVKGNTCVSGTLDPGWETSEGEGSGQSPHRKVELLGQGVGHDSGARHLRNHKEFRVINGHWQELSNSLNKYLLQVYARHCSQCIGVHW